jgi:hypothetical protein
VFEPLPAATDALFFFIKRKQNKKNEMHQHTNIDDGNLLDSTREKKNTLILGRTGLPPHHHI